MNFISTRETAENLIMSQDRTVVFAGNSPTTRPLLGGQLPVRPFLKWAGGKTQILGEIRLHYPTELGRSITKYAEPFVGGGAVLFDVLSNFNLEEVYISDINRELIATYICIRDNLDELIAELQTLAQEYISLAIDERKIYFYEKRKQFNALKTTSETNTTIAALFIFLNRTCFNGLYRVNKNGEFNVPMGKYKNPTICDADNLRAVSRKLQGVKILCGDYKESRHFIDAKTFAYFDPPYRPLSTTSSFTSYAQDGFGDQQQKELARFIDEMSEKGAAIVASNSDPRNVDENDDFFDKLYANHKIHRIGAARMINSVGSERGKISELLIANF